MDLTCDYLPAMWLMQGAIAIKAGQWQSVCNLLVSFCDQFFSVLLLGISTYSQHATFVCHAYESREAHWQWIAVHEWGYSGHILLVM